MKIVNFDEYNLNKKTLLANIPKSVFIYPTDTIYGIGCNALDEKLVARLRKIKNTEKPLSVIAPTKEWISNNCVITEEAEGWLKKLPGPYTLILKLKNPKAVAKNVYNNSEMTLGVRMPDNWFLEVAKSARIPIITTSANISGENFMTSIDDLDQKISGSVDYVFYDGDKKKGTPSTIINLAGAEIIIQKRLGPNSKSKKNASKKLKFPSKEIDSLKR
ncbi:MAG TPA: L-threonylcarbamoyladenylate synthase [Alphaproteobacteria bacterium]|nr:L-threonylcarbamoyladenylate synthase [Alphaproteobacteria bacterium]